MKHTPVAQPTTAPSRKAVTRALTHPENHPRGYILLSQEAKGEVETRDGHPVLGYDGPYIPSILQRPGDAPPDFAALDNFGVGEGEKYFGGDDA